MLRIEGREATEHSSTQFSDQDLEEDELREWILANPGEILGEDLLIIGREVQVANLNDGIGLLALDKSGNLVVVELKRGALRGGVDFQSLKYVSCVSM
jgi:RecB family endonuclease NucS